MEFSWSDCWWLHNIQVKTSRGVLFVPPSDPYVRSFLYLLYTLIKLFTQKLWAIKPRLWPRIKFSSRGQKSRRHNSTTTFQSQPQAATDLLSVFINLPFEDIPLWATLVAQLVKNPPAVRENWIRSLCWEDPLEKGMATHSSILAWRIPWTIQSMGSQRVEDDWLIYGTSTVLQFLKKTLQVCT